MTVYDQVIPNGAFEPQLHCLGVVIALGFDFIIKGLRAKFIDVASKSGLTSKSLGDYLIGY